MAASRINLPPVDPPPFGGAASRCGRQPATRRRAQIRFDTQCVEQGAVVHRIQPYLPTQVLGPVLRQGQARVLQVLHHQDQRSGRLATGHGADDLLCLRKVGFAAAQRPRDGQAEQAVFMQ